MPEHEAAGTVAVPGSAVPGADVSWALATWLVPVMVVVIGVLFVGVGSLADGGRAWWVGVAVVFVLGGFALARGGAHPRRAGTGLAMLVAGVLTLVVNLVSVLG